MYQKVAQQLEEMNKKLSRQADEIAANRKTVDKHSALAAEREEAATRLRQHVETVELTVQTEANNLGRLP